HRRRHRHSQGPAARRRQRAGHEDPGVDLAHRRRPGGPRQARRRREDHGLRTPRLQDRGPARDPPAPHVAGTGRGPRGRHVLSDVQGDGGGRLRGEGPLPERRFLRRDGLPLPWHSDRPVHSRVLDQPHVRLDGTRDRAARRQPPDPPGQRVHRRDRPEVEADRRAMSLRDDAEREGWGPYPLIVAGAAVAVALAFLMDPRWGGFTLGGVVMIGAALRFSGYGGLLAVRSRKADAITLGLAGFLLVLTSLLLDNQQAKDLIESLFSR